MTDPNQFIQLPVANPLTVQVDLGGIWHIAIFTGIAMAIFRLIWLAEYPFSIKALWAYVLIYALFILEYPIYHFDLYTTAYRAEAGQTLVEAIFIPLAAFLFFRWVKKLLPYLAIFACVSVWMNWPGLLNAPSFNSAMAALTLPFIPWWASIFVLGTIFTHHGSTAILIVIAQLLAFALKHKAGRIGALVVIPALIAIAYFHHHGTWFDSSDRIFHWKRYMELWATDWKWIALGVGPGTFMWTAALYDHFQPPIFLQMHSDWLQILWELGVVGFVLSLWVFIAATKKAWSNINALAGVFGSLAFMLTYHPLRYFPTALLVAWIVVSAFSVVEDVDFKLTR